MENNRVYFFSWKNLHPVQHISLIRRWIRLWLSLANELIRVHCLPSYWFLFLIIIVIFPLFFLSCTSAFIRKRCSVDLLRPFPYIVHISPLMRLIKPSSHRTARNGWGGMKNRKGLSDRDRRDNGRQGTNTSWPRKKKCMYLHGQRNKKTNK